MKRLLNNCNQTTTDALLSVVLNIHAHVASDTFSKSFFPLFVSCTKKQNKTKKMLPPVVISTVMFLHLFQGYCLVIWFDYWSVWWCLTLKSKWEWSQMRFNKQKKSGSWSCSHCCDNWYFCLFESLNAKINSTFWLLRGIHYKDSWQWI